MINLKKQKLLVIAPHPDDEIIGCGGLIKKIKDNGGKAYVLFLTNGDTKDFSRVGNSTIKQRNKEIEKVAEFLKFDVYDIALSGNDYHLKLDLVGQNKIMEIIERGSKVSMQKVKPDIIAFPSIYSYNQDHRTAALATHAALRPSVRETKHIVTTALMYEEAADQWSLEKLPIPNFFVSLTTNQLKAKLSALKLYKSQDRPSPNMRSLNILEKLAILRGSIIGEKFAESYTLLKQTI